MVDSCKIVEREFKVALECKEADCKIILDAL